VLKRKYFGIQEVPVFDRVGGLANAVWVNNAAIRLKNYLRNIVI